VLSLPLRQAHRELLWFAGLAGLALGAWFAAGRRTAVLATVWLAAAIMAIALNGRDLPQYFVQATPALAFAAATGLLAAWHSRAVVARAIVGAVLVVGFWRVGVEAPVFGLARLAGLPGLTTNIAFDVDYWRGRIDRRTYLDRFGGSRDQDKYSALDVDDVARLVTTRTAPSDRILVFGFSPGIYVKAGRTSASRFFWNHPIVTRFAESEPGYGSAGLLEDLLAAPPALVVLQKGDWTPDSWTFFMAEPVLSSWLASNYHPIDNNERYGTWERNADAGVNARQF
jgi:hypothetical protein